MKKCSLLAGLAIAAWANGTLAQTVTGSGNANTVPVLTSSPSTGNSTITNSPITVSGGNVGIGLGTTAPLAPLDINGGLYVRGYATANTGASDAGYWALMGDCTVTVQFKGCNAIIQVLDGVQNGSNNGDMSATVNWRVKQQTAFGTNPYVELDVGNLTGGYLQPSQFIAVITSNTPTTDVQLWVQITDTWESFTFTPTIVQTSSTGQLTFYSNSTLQSTEPTGISPQISGSVVANVAGSATSPSITFTGDSSTGIFQPVSNSVGISTNGVERLRVNPSGNVGIGTTSPADLLDVNGAVHAAGNLGIGTVNDPEAGSAGALQLGNGPISFLSNSIDAYVYKTGTTSNPYPFNALGHLVLQPRTSQPRDIIFAVAANGNTTPSPAMVIQNGGNVGIGTTSPTALLSVGSTSQFTVSSSGAVSTGSVNFTGANGGQQTTPWTGVLCGGDYAEDVNPAGDTQSYEPGDVLVITDGTGGDGEVRKSAEAYSTMVAGIYATKPGVVGRRESIPKDAQDLPMAMVGIVPTKVTAENGPIHRGDLLVTSSTSGYAMKGTDRNRLVGAVIGKAMGKLDSGSGVIEVLVTLQ